jgi:hypothetical protein
MVSASLTRLLYSVARFNDLFIEVSEGGRFDFVVEFDPKGLAKKTWPAIVVTYESMTLDVELW